MKTHELDLWSFSVHVLLLTPTLPRRYLIWHKMAIIHSKVTIQDWNFKSFFSANYIFIYHSLFLFPPYITTSKSFNLCKIINTSEFIEATN